MVSADRDDDLVGHAGAEGRVELEAPAGSAAQAGDGDPFEDGRLERRRVALEVADDLVLLHEAERLRPAVGKARELALPVRRDEAERVPPSLTPLVADLVLLEDEVVDPPLLEAIAHGQARLPAADDGDAAAGARQLEADDGHGGVRVVARGVRFDLRELIDRRAAVAPVLRAHALRGDREQRPASLDEPRDCVTLADLQVVPHDQRRRVTALLFAVGPPNQEMHLRHD